MALRASYSEVLIPADASYAREVLAIQEQSDSTTGSTDGGAGALFLPITFQGSDQQRYVLWERKPEVSFILGDEATLSLQQAPAVCVVCSVVTWDVVRYIPITA